MAEIDIKSIIDSLDNDTLRKFNKDLKSSGAYEGLLTETGETIEDIRKSVKLVTSQLPWPKFLDFAPEPVKALLKPFNEPEKAPPIETQVKEIKQKPEPKKPELLDDDENKPLIIQELMVLVKNRDGGGRVQGEHRERFTELVTRLNKQYKMSVQAISDVIGVRREALSQSIDKYYREHPDLLNLPFEQSKPHDLPFAEKGAEDGVRKTIESQLVNKAQEITSKYHNLGRDLYQKYEIDALQMGKTVPVMSMEAMSLYLKYRDLYITMLNMERDKITAIESANALAQDNQHLRSRIRNLNRILLNKIRS